MNRLQQLIASLNDMNVVQNASWEYMIPDYITEEYPELKTPNVVAEGLDMDKRRWYELATDVVRFADDGFIGVRHVKTVFSESMDVVDCYHKLEFFEMEAVPSVTYRKVKKD